MNTTNKNQSAYAAGDQAKIEALKQYRSLSPVLQSDFEAVTQLDARYKAAVKQLDAQDYKTIANGVIELADCGGYRNSDQKLKDGIQKFLLLTDEKEKLLKEKDAKLALSVKKLKDYQTKSAGQNSKIKDYQEKNKSHEAELGTYKETVADLNKQIAESKDKVAKLEQQIKGYKDIAASLETKLASAQSKIALDEKLLSDYREKDTKQQLALNEANKKISELEKKLAEKENASGGGNPSTKSVSSATQRTIESGYSRTSAAAPKKTSADNSSVSGAGNTSGRGNTNSKIDELEKAFRTDYVNTEKDEDRTNAGDAQLDVSEALKEYLKKRNAEVKENNKRIQNNLNRYKVGSLYQFGKYPQKKKAKLWGKEEYLEQPIEWNILANDGEKLLLISSYAIEHKKFNEEFKGTNWENCSLRKWLNSDFITKAFSPEERKKILEVTNENKKNIVYSTSESNKTMDKVFLLSIDEVDRYFTKRKLSSNVLLNDYTMQWKNGIRNKWWLRTAGAGNDMAAVDDGGHLSYSGLPVNSDNGFVRPAVWVKI